MPNLPSGTVTFVFSDIEGSTTLLKQLGDDTYAGVLRTHRRLIREQFSGHNGHEIDTQGDAFFYSFVRAKEAVNAAVAVQRAHHTEPWPGGAVVRIRLGLHTGEPAVGEDGYTGLDVVRASRIAAVARGGQVLLSDTTRALVAGSLPEGVTVRALGERQLRDIDRPEPLHELAIPGVDVTPEQELAPVEGGPVRDALAGLPPWIRGAAEGAIPPVGRMSRLIEQRVLAELDRDLREEGVTPGTDPGRRTEAGPTRAGPPRAGPSHSARPNPAPGRAPPIPPPSRPVSDEVARLRELRDAGDLTDEQFAKAVDRVVSAKD